jgi:hypothetical protein
MSGVPLISRVLAAPQASQGDAQAASVMVLNGIGGQVRRPP